MIGLELPRIARKQCFVQLVYIYGLPLSMKKCGERRRSAGPPPRTVPGLRPGRENGTNRVRVRKGVWRLPLPACCRCPCLTLQP